MSGDGLQHCELGDLVLESGEVLPDFRMSFVTRGTLNARRDNVILALHGLVADHTQLLSWAGPGAALDTDKYYIVFADTLGVTTANPQATTSATRTGRNMAFPRFTIRDMVKGEHLLLTEALGIDHIVAVVGVSMGGIGALQWAVSYPDFMDAAIPVTTQARANRSTGLLWETARQVIMLDPKWRSGDYPNDDPPRQGTMVGRLVQALYAGTAAGFEERYPDGEAIRQFYLDQSKQLGNHTYARDWVFRTWALDSHDIAGTLEFGGNLTAAARSVRARLLMIVNSLDQLLPPFESGVMEVARNASDVKVVDFEGLRGHYAHRDASGMALLTTEIRDLFTRIKQGRPGFSGPRYPPHWIRAQVEA